MSSYSMLSYACSSQSSGLRLRKAGVNGGGAGGGGGKGGGQAIGRLTQARTLQDCHGISALGSSSPPPLGMQDVSQ